MKPLTAKEKYAALARLSAYPHHLYEVTWRRRRSDQSDVHTDLDADDYDAEEGGPARGDIETANCWSSRIGDSENHCPFIDIDMPVKVVPSSTPGHYHLYIDHPVPWPKYLALLEAMVDAGIVQPGYLRASRARGFTSLRLPWARKESGSGEA